MSPQRVSPLDAKRRQDEEGYVLLDVRSIAEFEAGHAEGAYNVPFMHMGPGGMEPNDDFLDVIRSNFTKDTPLIVACRSGGRSRKAAALLKDAGYGKIFDLTAGYSGSSSPGAEPGWEPSGLPCATKAEPGRSYHELAERAGRG